METNNLPNGVLKVKCKPLGNWPEREFELHTHLAGLGYVVFQDGKRLGNIPTQNVKDNLYNGFYSLIKS